MSAFGLNPFKSPAIAALWYVRALFLFVVLSPLLKKCANCLGLSILLVIYAYVGLRYPFYSDMGQLFYFGVSMEGMFYFTLGIFCMRNGVLPKGRLVFCISSIVSILGAVYLIGRRCGMVDCLPVPYYVVRMVFVFAVIVCGWILIPARRFPELMIRSSFSIFVAHQLLLGIVKFVPLGAFAYRNIKTSAPLWVFYVLAVSTLAACLGFVMKRFAPALAKIVYGGR